MAHGRSVFAAQAMGADFGYIGSAFLSTPEANVVDGYRQMIVDSSASDIVYSNLFTGVHGNYLSGSIRNAGLDPQNLEVSDPSKMTFGSDRDQKKPKAWKEIWGSGQGIGTIKSSVSTREFVATLAQQYRDARAAMLDGALVGSA